MKNCVFSLKIDLLSAAFTHKPPFPSLVKALRCWSIFVWLDLAQSGAWVRANLSQLWSFHTWKAANPCLLHSKLCYEQKCFVTHVTNKSAKLESTAARQLGWFHTWREVKQPPAWQQPQPGTIISFLAMHTAQITQKYFTNIAQILHKYCRSIAPMHGLGHPAQTIWTNISQIKGLSTIKGNTICFPLEEEEQTVQ